MKLLLNLLVLLLMLLAPGVYAEDMAISEELPSPRFLARFEQNSPMELKLALQRAESMFLEGRFRSVSEPAVFVLHGPEVALFFKENYLHNQSLIDLAARLSALGVIDVKVCETRTGVMGRDRDSLVPFVGTVPFGPEEIQRLQAQEGYVYF